MVSCSSLSNKSFYSKLQLPVFTWYPVKYSFYQSFLFIYNASLFSLVTWLVAWPKKSPTYPLLGKTFPPFSQLSACLKIVAESLQLFYVLSSAIHKNAIIILLRFVVHLHYSPSIDDSLYGDVPKHSLSDFSVVFHLTERIKWTETLQHVKSRGIIFQRLPNGLKCRPLYRKPREISQCTVASYPFVRQFHCVHWSGQNNLPRSQARR